MKYTTTHLIYFSPTRTSAKIARAIGKGTGTAHYKETDLTCDTDTTILEVKAELAVITVPVYAGRVAPIALARLKRLRGENTPVILIAVYGNRDYEDALVELRDLVSGQGFLPVSAGAFVGEHSYSRKEMPIAEGRPDKDDIGLAEEFGCRSAEKLHQLTDINALFPFFIKGNVPYREVAPSTPSAPLTLSDRCTACGICVTLCPTNAISLNKNGMIETEKKNCIKCCACVKECPSEARVFDTPYTAMLHEKCAARRKPECFM